MSSKILKYDVLLERVESFETYKQYFNKVDKEFWEETKAKDTQEQYQQYLKTFFHPLYEKEAKNRIFSIKLERERKLEREDERKRKIAEQARAKKMEEEELIDLVNTNSSSDNNKITKIEELKEIRYLYFGTKSTYLQIPKGIEKLENLESIQFNGQQVEFPESIKKLKKLKRINFRGYQVLNIPISIDYCRHLIAIEFNYIMDINFPSSIRPLETIKELHCNNTDINIESIIKLFKNLEIFQWDSPYDTNLTVNISKNVIKLENLKNLRIWGIESIEFPKSIGSMKKLEAIHISDCRNVKFLEPIEVGHSLKELYIRGISGGRGGNLLFPKSIGNFKNLEILNIEHIRIDLIPESIGSLKNLEKLTLFIFNSARKHLPNSIGNLSNLKELHINDFNLPSSIRKLKLLKNHKFLCQRIDEIDNQAWNSAKYGNDIEGYKRYLNEFPDGLYRDEANKIVNPSLFSLLFGKK